MRIVSLLPSATEILFALGVGDDVVGVTFECDHPDEARTRRIVSTSSLPEGLSPGAIDAVVKERMAAGEDLYRLDEGALADIDPTLVVTQDLCAVCAVDIDEVDDAMAHLGCAGTVLTLDPMSLGAVLDTIVATGIAVDRSAEAAALVGALVDRLDAVAEMLGRSRWSDGVTATTTPVTSRATLVLEWTDPAFGAGHWVPDLVAAAGGDPVLSRPGEHSIGLEWADVSTCGAEVVLVAPCGYRLDGAAALAEEVAAAGRLPPGAEVWALDADAHIVRPGPRVVDGVEVIARVLHPERIGAPSPEHARRVR